MENVKNACRGHLFALPKFFTKNLDKANRKIQNTNKRWSKMSTAILNQTNNDRLTQHFKAEEFRCKDGTKEFLWAPELLAVLERIRNHFNEPVIINSGYRTPTWNTKVGGAKNSYHMKGMAADIVVKNHNSKEVAEYASKVLGELGGVIRYSNFVHIDVRENKYRKGV